MPLGVRGSRAAEVPMTQNLNIRGLRAYRPAWRVANAASRNPANEVVVLLGVLGSRNVGMSATQTLNIRGLRAYKRAKANLPRPRPL